MKKILKKKLSILIIKIYKIKTHPKKPKIYIFLQKIFKITNKNLIFNLNIKMNEKNPKKKKLSILKIKIYINFTLFLKYNIIYKLNFKKNLIKINFFSPPSPFFSFFYNLFYLCKFKIINKLCV
jgi:hypothetical protein